MSKEPKVKTHAVAKAPKLSRKVRHFGVDLDGSTVRVVEVFEGQVVSYTTYQGPDTATALAQFMATKPSGSITLAWSAGNIHVRRVIKPNLPTVAMRAGLSEVVDESLPTPPGTTTVAARTVLDADGHEHAAVAAVDNEAVTQVFGSIDSDGAPLVPTPLLFTVDGLYLGLRESTAELYLVLGGAITAARPLSAGGLSLGVREVGRRGTERARALLHRDSRWRPPRPARRGLRRPVRVVDQRRSPPHVRLLDPPGARRAVGDLRARPGRHPAEPGRQVARRRVPRSSRRAGCRCGGRGDPSTRAARRPRRVCSPHSSSRRYSRWPCCPIPWPRSKPPRPRNGARSSA